MGWEGGYRRIGAQHRSSAYADFHDPQTLNLYGYVRGLPTIESDIDGHGFWRKFGNSFASDGCFCEDDDLKRNQEAKEKERKEDAAKEQWILVDSPSAKQWAKDHGGMSPRDALSMGMLLMAGVQTGYACGPEPTPVPPPEDEGAVIGKVTDLNEPGAVRAGEQKLNLPDQGSPKANWAQNSSKLRETMRLGRSIRDVSVDASGNLKNNTGFLRAERNLLLEKGWTYDPKTTTWNPPPVK